MTLATLVVLHDVDTVTLRLPEGTSRDQSSTLYVYYELIHLVYMFPMVLIELRCVRYVVAGVQLPQQVWCITLLGWCICIYMSCLTTSEQKYIAF